MKFLSFTIRGFKRPHEAVGLALGKLEREVMEIAWQRAELSVKDLHAAFGGRIAYTTLMTTADRLHKKGLLNRRKEGRAFSYSPRVTREQFHDGIAKDVLDGLLSSETRGSEPVLACIVEAVSERDRALLDELERLVKEKRRELRRKE